MTLTRCEAVRLAATALADGEPAALSAAAVAAHAADCPACAAELAAGEALTTLLAGRRRAAPPAVDLWARLGPALPPLPVPVDARLFWGLGLALATYKAVELIPDLGPGLLLKLIPVLLAEQLFRRLRENPFAINTTLTTPEVTPDD